MPGPARGPVDELAAVDAAAAVFRRRGCTATSVDHLVGATGVHRGSLYGVFGSKHGLLLRVLERAANLETRREEQLDLLLVALLELAPNDPRVRDPRAVGRSAAGPRRVARRRRSHDEHQLSINRVTAALGG